ncbi:oligosaccharide flippase family protein [Methanococcoides sp. SA1]|nr:oligosaccharide flippase family protein [Methanococcoides sp. SA1]
MLKQIKSLTKQTLVYGVGTIATRMVTFLLLPVYTNILPDEKYGQAALIFTFLAMMNHVYNYGLDSAFMRYYSNENGEKDKTKILSSAMMMATVSSLGLSLLVFAFRIPLAGIFLDSGSFSIFFIYAAAILFFDCLARIPFAFLRQERRPMMFMGVRFVNVILTLGLNIIFVAVLKQGVEGIFRSNLIVSIVTSVLLFAIMFKKVKFQFSGKIAKKLFMFGIPFVPSGLAVAAMEMWNRMILKQFLGLDEVGVFSAAYKLGIFMLLVSTGFYYAWQPFFLREGKKEESRILFGRVMTYFIIVALGSWVFLTAFIHDIANIHIGNQYLLGLDYQEGIKIVPFILLGYVFFGINQVLLPGYYFEKKTKYLAAITIVAAVVNVSLNYLLIPKYGIMGPGFAMIAGNVALVTMTFFTSQTLFKVHYEYKRVFLLFTIFLLAGFGIYFFQPHVLIKVAIVLVLPLMLKLLNFFNAEELGLLKRLVKRG